MRDGLRRYPHPGKFEGELLVAVPLYQLSLDGHCDEEIGDACEGPVWFGLLRGPFMDITEADGEPLNEQEREFLASLAGAIVEESSDGFVSVTYYEDSDELERAWQELAGLYE